MEKRASNIQILDIVPLDKSQQCQIKGGKSNDDKRHHRPGTGVTTLSNTTERNLFLTFLSCVENDEF